MRDDFDDLEDAPFYGQFFRENPPLPEPKSIPDPDSTIEEVLEGLPRAFWDAEIQVCESASAFLDPALVRGPTTLPLFIDNYFRLVPPPTPDEAWIHCWRLFLEIEDRTGLPAVIDGNLMQPGKKSHSLAVRTVERLVEAWAISPIEIADRINLVCGAGGFYDRNTAVGIGFELAIQHLLQAIGGVEPRKVLRGRLLNNAPGFRQKSSGGDRKPDLMVVGGDGKISAVFPVKWSLRGDRLGGAVMDASASRVRSEHPLKVMLVTNDFDEGRLTAAIEARCDHTGGLLFDAVIHVAPHMLQAAYNQPVLQHYADEGRFRSLAYLLKTVRAI